MMGIVTGLVFVFAGATADVALLNAECTLKKPTYFFAEPVTGSPVKTLPAGTRLKLGQSKGKRIAVSVIGEPIKGYIPLKWSKKACVIKPASTGANADEEKGSTEEAPPSESEEAPEPKGEGDDASDAKTESETEPEIAPTTAAEAEPESEEPTDKDEANANDESDVRETEPDESKAESVEESAEKSTEKSTNPSSAESSEAATPDNVEEPPVAATEPTESIKREETEASDAKTETEVVPEAQATPSVDVAGVEEPPRRVDESSAPAAENDVKPESVEVESPKEDEGEDENVVGVLNVPKLPSVVRSSPKIFEPLIGRDKVKRIVVLDTRIDDGINESLDGGGMGALIAAELQNLADGLFEVVARADLMALVTRLEQAQLMGCADESCMTDIGALAQADFLVASSVTPAGNGRLLTVELLDALSGQAMRREAVTWAGDTKGLVELCAPQTARLVDAERGQSYSGAIQLVATEDGAEVYVDEQLAGETPIDIFANLDIGSHKLTVKKSGYNLFEIPVVVGRNQTSLVQAELIRPWYREWWVWTAAGAVLTTAVLSFALSGDEIVRQEDLPDTVIGIDTSVDTGAGR